MSSMWFMRAPGNTCQTSMFYVDLYQKYGKQDQDRKPEANMMCDAMDTTS